MVSVEPVLVISPEVEHQEKINAAVRRCGLTAVYCSRFAQARSLIGRQKFSMVFCDETLPDGDFQGVIAAASFAPVVVVSRFAEWDHYVWALRAGAFEYLAWPPAAAEAERIVQLAMDKRRRDSPDESSDTQAKVAAMAAS